MEFTYFNESGRTHMINVNEKDDTKRVVVARGSINKVKYK